jgi:ankyrin repeat protein
LHLAVRTGWPRGLIATLLKYGADPARPRADGATAYQLAIRYGRGEVAELLASQGPSLAATAADRFLGACLRGDEAEARAQLAETPSLVRDLTRDQQRALLEPAKRGELATLKLMGALGFDLAVKGENGETPLHHACWYGRTDVAIWLIRKAVPLDEADRQFDAPPVGWCAHGSQFCRNPRGDYPAIMEALIRAGAHVPRDTRAAPEVMAVLERHGHGKAPG